jgi:hypothetical protein
MSKLKLSNTQRDLYLSCPKKYYFRYIRKMRPRAKGSALFFGGAFDHAIEGLLADRQLAPAKVAFTERWMAQEGNLNCKFSKTDYVEKILQPDDIARLTACVDNLNKSKALDDYHDHRNVLKLVSDIKKMKEASFLRDLTHEEEQFLHFATLLSMNRKGHLMLESFHEHILPHITQVVGTQVEIDIQHPDQHKITGFIDLLCKMEGFKLPSGRVLTADDVVVADVKSAGAAYWAKLDDLNNSDQLDVYLVAPQVQNIRPTNLVAYFATSKQISTHEESICKSCGNLKRSSHKTCNAEVDGKRCNGEWELKQRFYCESKIVIGERNVEEAQLILNDYDDVLVGVSNHVFPRNRNSCNLYGGVCEFIDVCGRCFTKEQEDAKVDEWIKKHGE